MATYNVSISSKKANVTIAGTQVTADTEQLAQKAANGQAAVLSHQDHQGAWDWRATITTA